MSIRHLRVLVLPRYGRLGASSRLRQLEYLPDWQAQGVEVCVHSFLSDDALKSRYGLGRYGLKALLLSYLSRIRVLMQRRSFDVLWVEKEALPWLPSAIETVLLRGVPYVLDYDDAVFHNYDLHRFALVRWLLGKRLDRLMSRSALVTCGNRYLAKRATHAGSLNVEIIPTVIDLSRYGIQRYAAKDSRSELPVIVWIGSPSTVKYLALVSEQLRELSRRMPFVLRVIGGMIDLPGVNVDLIPWSEETEVASIALGDIGIMPLEDSPWERGKCGYKLIQYMACGLPVVASPVGVNSEIVRDGINGYLADTGQDWVEKLARLLSDRSLRLQMGQEGRKMVERQYCVQVVGPHLLELLCRASSKV